MEASAPALKERNDPDMDAAPAATTAPATIPPQLKQRPQVPAGDGTSQLVYKPWTFNNMKEAASQLPLVENRGAEYVKQLLIFCQQFRPTTTEL
ncbi:uncharacterized protein AKAME5_002904700 [Lates japonicus]|uniref:Uncharacterized protein n=1 Tax=Lates japonicus TaxID=270547 RepID=A0AAD3MVF3_LATJO|nr:uncharacterized protein AKAME5_002904700 [Lates japonicus]